MSSLYDFILVLQTFFPGVLRREKALKVLSKLASLFPVVQLHRNQQTEPRQPNRTGWIKSATDLISSAFDAENTPELEHLVPEDVRGNILAETWLAREILFDVDNLYDLLDIDGTHPDSLFPKSSPVLITRHQDCIVCPPNDKHTLRRKDRPQVIRLLNPDYKWCQADLFIAHCPRCRSDYYPDKYTFIEDEDRQQKLELDSEYLRVSKSGVWVHRSIAEAQERAIFRFHCGWSNFANWINDILEPGQPQFTNRQSQRLYLEHASRRLLLAHNMGDNFACEANPSSTSFASSLRDVIGKDGGRIPSSFHHGCKECTHKKRYRADLVAEGTPLQAQDDGVVQFNPEDIPVPNVDVPPPQVPSFIYLS